MLPTATFATSFVGREPTMFDVTAFRLGASVAIPIEPTCGIGACRTPSVARKIAPEADAAVCFGAVGGRTACTPERAGWTARLDNDAQQLPNSCGYVAAWVARRLLAHLQPAGGGRHAQPPSLGTPHSHSRCPAFALLVSSREIGRSVLVVGAQYYLGRATYREYAAVWVVPPRELTAACVPPPASPRCLIASTGDRSRRRTRR